MSTKLSNFNLDSQELYFVTSTVYEENRKEGNIWQLLQFSFEPTAMFDEYISLLLLLSTKNEKDPYTIYSFLLISVGNAKLK